MKRFFSVLLGVAMTIAVAAPFTACSAGEKISANGYTVTAEKQGDGYGIKISKNGVSYKTSDGAMGVRFDKNTFRADDPIYADYETVAISDGGLVAKGSVSSETGSRVDFADYFSITASGVNVDRKFTVQEVGQELGFMTEMKFIDTKKGGVLDSDWFVPSTHYITGKHGFSETSNRMYFSGSSFVIPADDVSVLTAARYADGKSFSLTDTTPGYRENIIDDNISNETVLYIDENINVPGIVVAEENEKVAISHIYPSYSNKKADVYRWRLLPLEKDFTRTVSFIIEIGEEENYSDMLRNVWRSAYDRFGYADKRYAASDVYEVLIDAIDRSYSSSNIWGNIPMYMTNTDHYFPDSGFLYRNIELATLMLKEGRARKDEGMVQEAWTVIHDQLENDRLDTGMRAYLPDNSVYKRVLYEGLGSAVDLYVYENSVEGKDEAFLDSLLDYIVDKAEKYKDDTSAMALNFYMTLYKYQDELFCDYTDVALGILEKAYEDCKDYYGYYGAVESTNTLISVAEDYMILLRAFLTAYEIDGQQKWLEKSIILADYLETYQMIQPFQMNLIGATGSEGYYLAFMGNERFLGHGYIYNNTQHGILDIANTSSVIEYYKLYMYTQDEHYLAFAQDKFYNAFLYINMGDKVGYMDDPVHSAGKGFMNEFAGNSTFNSGYAEGGIRGAAHDSNIAWNVWQIVSVFEYFKETYGGLLPEGMSADLTHDLAFTKYVVGDAVAPRYSAAKAVDGDSETVWKPSGDHTAVIDLNEFCQVSSVGISAAEEGAAAKVSFSVNGKDFTDEKDVVFTGKEGTLNASGVWRYVKVCMTSGTAVSDISVQGVPCFYETVSDKAAVISGDTNAKNCLDAGNYDTAWNAGATSEEKTVVIDLGSPCMIFQTALKFAEITDCAYRIEISDDNVTYVPYAESAGGTDKFVFVDAAYAEGRYVKLTLLHSSAENFMLSDFKVMGHRLSVV